MGTRKFRMSPVPGIAASGSAKATQDGSGASGGMSRSARGLLTRAASRVHTEDLDVEASQTRAPSPDTWPTSFGLDAMPMVQ